MSSGDVLGDTIDRLVEAGWALVRDLVPPDEIEALRSEAVALLADGAFREAGIGGAARERHPEIRSDVVHWLEAGDADTAGNRYLARMESLRVTLNRALYLGLESFDGHYAVYPPGSCYQRHLDASRRAPRRALTCITYLNPGWTVEDGGQLRLYLPAGDDTAPPSSPTDEEQPLDVLPSGGSTILFLADRIEHEVLPARRQRMSLTGWFQRRP